MPNVYKLQIWHNRQWITMQGAAHMDELIIAANATKGKYRILKNGKVLVTTEGN